MELSILIIFSLLFLIFFLVMLGNKVRISQPIILVLGGLLIGLVPGIPFISIGPELIFTIFLPPILFDAAWYTSWNDFWRNKNQILLLAFGLVFFTSAIVALVSSSLIPGFTLALGFLLGGIISPPDAVAAVSVLRDIPMPKKLVAILEGESLLNDASSLIVFSFALTAVLSGGFSMQDAIGDFFMVVVMGSLIGLAIAVIISLLLRYLPTTKQIDTAIMLMAPYMMFLAAEHFHFSGVLAVVFGGLYLSHNSHEILNHASRFQSASVWDSFIFILNGLVFILIGLQLPVIVQNFSYTTLGEAILYGLLISVVAIVVRMLWIFFASYLRSRFQKNKNLKNHFWKTSLVLGWSGMRGVVSLAAALNIPIYLYNGEAFPKRNLILFITFVVILFTLLLQGFTLPFLVKKLKLETEDEVIPEHDQKDTINIRLSNLALLSLNTDHAAELRNNQYLQRLKKLLEARLDSSLHKLSVTTVSINDKKHLDIYYDVYRQIINLQRQELASLRRDNVYLDEKIREALDALDLEEMRMNSS